MTDLRIPELTWGPGRYLLRACFAGFVCPPCGPPAAALTPEVCSRKTLEELDSFQTKSEDAMAGFSKGLKKIIAAIGVEIKKELKNRESFKRQVVARGTQKLKQFVRDCGNFEGGWQPEPQDQDAEGDFQDGRGDFQDGRR